jgi:hypothetical protein
MVMEWRRTYPFELLFLATREIEHFVCVFEEDGAFGFGLGDIEGASEYGHFRA